MKYVDENAWAELLGAIKDGTLLSQDATTRAQAITKLPELTDLVLPPALANVDLSELLDKVTAIGADLEDANELELGLANLSYLFHLAAKSWQDAYDRVSQYASKESAAKFLTQLPGRLLLIAVQTGLAALTAGSAALIYNAFTKPLKVDLEKMWCNDGVSDSSKEGIKGILDVMVSAAPVTGAPVSGDTMVDPKTVFSNYEEALRKTALDLRVARKQNKQLVSSGDLKNKLVDAIKKTSSQTGGASAIDDGFANFILSPIDADSIDAKWGLIAQVLATTMRRAAWTQYCRSNWRNITWDYTITVKSTPAAKQAMQAEDDPRKWPSNVWDSVKGWPQYWAQICADFCGPEHSPKHPLHEQKTPAEKEEIAKLESRMAWISLAAVSCCQIKNHFDGQPRAKKFDLQDFPLPATTPATTLKASQLLLEKTWSDTYKPYRSKKNATCQIVGFRFSDKPSIQYGIPTGKKGKQDTPHDAANCLVGANKAGFQNGVCGVIIQRSDIVSTDQVELNWAVFLISEAEAKTVIHQINADGSYQFIQKTTVNNKTTLAPLKPAVPPSGVIWKTSFKTGATQTGKLNFKGTGLYAFWLTTAAKGLDVSKEVWYVWVKKV